MTLDELNVLVNSYQEGTQGHHDDRHIIAILYALGNVMGYGALHQMASWIYEIQCHGDPKNAADMKRSRFGSLGWKLPENFEQVAKGVD